MKISIITVTKNNKAGLLRAIESVRSQTYKNVEHIVVDGGSTDGSAELIKNLEFRMYNGQFTIYNEQCTMNNDLNDGTSNNLNTLKMTNENHESLFTNHYSLITISEPDNGIYDAINKGIKLATGDVIGLLHSDDFYSDEFVLERYAEVFQDKRLKGKDKSIPSSGEEARDHKDFSVTALLRNDNTMATTNHQLTIDAVYSDLVYVRSKTKDEKRKKYNSESIENSAPVRRGTLNIEYSVIRTWKTHKTVTSEQSIVNSGIPTHYSPLTTHHLLNGWMPPHPTLFVRREVFEKYGLYRTDMKIAADYEMILRLFYKYKITTHYLPLTTYCMTIGGVSNKSLRNIFIKSSEDYRAMKLHVIPFPLKTLFMKNIRKLPQFFKENRD